MRFVADIARTSGQSVEKDSDGWSAKDWRKDECLTYRVDLDAIGASHDTDVGFRLGGDRVAAPQLLLLRPDTQGDASADVSVTLPDGWNVSAPWEETSRDDKSIHFRVPNTPVNWSANVAFGHFKEERLPLPGGVFARFGTARRRRCAARKTARLVVACDEGDRVRVRPPSVARRAGARVADAVARTRGDVRPIDSRRRQCAGIAGRSDPAAIRIRGRLGRGA